MPEGIVFRRIDWKDAEDLNLDWSQAFTISPELRASLGKSKRATLVDIAEYVRPDTIRPYGPIKVLTKRGTGPWLTVEPAKPFPPSAQQPTAPTAQQPGVREEDTLYFDEGRGDLYLEVAVPGPAGLSEVKRIEKKLTTEVTVKCRICGRTDWKLTNSRMLHHTIEGKPVICFRLSFVCANCRQATLTVGTKTRSVFNRIAGGIKGAFRRLKGFEVSGDPTNPKFKLDLADSKPVLDRC